MKLTDPSPAHESLSGIEPDAHINQIGASPGNIGTTDWVRPGWSVPGFTSSAIVDNRVYYTPIWLDRSTSFTRLGLNVSIAGAALSVARLGIYAAIIDGGGKLQPDTLTLDAGTVVVDSTGGKEIVISLTLMAGYHFLVISTDGVPSLFRVAGGNPGIIPVITRAVSPAQTSGHILTRNVVDGASAFVDPSPSPDAIRAFTETHVMLRY